MFLETVGFEVFYEKIFCSEEKFLYYHILFDVDIDLIRLL